jgi:hypothetical protein
MLVVMVKANAPEAKAVQGFILVASARRRRASLSVSSATNIVINTVRKSVSRLGIKPKTS